MIRRRTSNRNRFRLSAIQAQTIHETAKGPTLRHTFLLCVGRTLQLSRQPSGFVADQLVSAAIDQALREVQAA